VITPRDDEAIGRGAPRLVLDDDEIAKILDEALDLWDVSGKRVLVLVPDLTRSAPIARMYRLFGDALWHRRATVTWMVALGS
jgi:hypothetical protein